MDGFGGGASPTFERENRTLFKVLFMWISCLRDHKIDLVEKGPGKGGSSNAVGSRVDRMVLKPSHRSEYRKSAALR